MGSPEQSAVRCPATPTFHSSELEDSDESESHLVNDSGLRRFDIVQGELRWAKLYRTYPTPPRPVIPEPGKPGWVIPEDIISLSSQMMRIRGVIKEWLPSPIATDIERTLIAATAMATTANGFKRQLESTQAAEMARAERRKRSRRTLDIGGGPLYAKDGRAMIKKRREDEIAKQERELREKKAREVERICNKWKRLLPTIRNHDKKYSKRWASKINSFRNVSSW
ncbi:hypothetical protein K469DRAFT_604654 [Zopfia rhizophila CBS 207.26]|uniref:Uncharacterized protein n=1 Tax=Zopfia rhizophila CBS 207.26 TaxID=1314779 RepID=A0A6A6DC69_9PEZI|nr:hypothetical protein K469DRAFT_604654 [Zopfia rhizophila CBS 207.26]